MSAETDEVIKLRQLLYNKISKMEIEQREFQEFLKGIRKGNKR
jgi:hypothetical protein